MSIGSGVSTSSVLQDSDTASQAPIVTFTASQSYIGAASGPSKSAFTNALNNATAVAETAVIDVASAGATGINFAATSNVGATATKITLGGFRFKDIPAVFDSSGTIAWTIINVYTAASFTGVVSGNFAEAGGAGNGVFMVAGATPEQCIVANSVGGGSLNAGKTTSTLGGVNYYTQVHNVGTTSAGICIKVDGKTPIVAGTPTLQVSLKPVLAGGGTTLTFPSAATSTNLLTLATNGGSVTLRSYLPAAQPGYVSYVRIINTGSVAAQVSVAVIDPVSGQVGTSAPLPGGMMNAGAATNFSSTQIEAALGVTLAAALRPRLLFTAATTIQAQHYIINPNGTLTTLHSSD